MGEVAADPPQARNVPIDCTYAAPERRYGRGRIGFTLKLVLGDNHTGRRS